jgi:hypothetical protein
VFRHRVASSILGAFVVAGCASIAGTSDYAVDPCFDGRCLDGPADGPISDSAPPLDGPGPVDGSGDAPTDAPIDTAPPPSPGKSVVTLSGTGVAVGKVAIVTLTARDDADVAVPRTGAKVTFTQAGGTSVVTFGATVDRGDGTYQANVTGVTEGTKIGISAVLDGAPLTTAPASLRVANPIATGLTFSIDAANADRAGNFGGKNCAASGLTQWTDLTAASAPGALSSFADPCAAGSGWAGTGTPDNPHRLAFDGVDDNVAFGAINALQKYTVLAWIRVGAGGFAARTSAVGGGGFQQIVPILSKGTAESESAAIDIDYFLGIAPGGQLASDYENSTDSGNAALTGDTALALGTWYMVGTTLDAAAGTRALWVNGAMDGSVVPTLPPAGAASSAFVVGGSRTSAGVGGACAGAQGSSGCGRFKGDIALVLTYDHALTQTEIEKNCHAFSSRFGMLTCPN